MPIFIAALVGGLVSAAGSFIGRAMIALGVGIVAYSGLTVLLNSIKAQVQASISGIGADLLPVVGALQLDTATSILFSALAARLVIRGLTGGTIKRLVIK